MAKQTPKNATNEATDLEAFAAKLDALAAEAEAAGEELLSKKIANAAKSARHSTKQKAVRLKKVGGVVAAMKAKGLSDAEIVAALTAPAAE
jgi:hypothetical protein